MDMKILSHTLTRHLCLAKLIGPALALCKITYSDRAKQPPAFLES